jgi:glycosyltransferase involved in cell wall biosynthesis
MVGEPIQMTTPLVSVIIPAYNAEDFLLEAMESIQKQNYSPLEIIIVDDGSTDGTGKLAAGFGEDVRYVYQYNRGTAAARNKGAGHGTRCNHRFS